MDPHGWHSAFHFHQKVKFVMEENLVIMVAEEDMIAIGGYIILLRICYYITYHIILYICFVISYYVFIL